MRLRCGSAFAFVSSLGNPLVVGSGNHKSSLSDLVTLHVTIQFEALFAIDDDAPPFDRTRGAARDFAERQADMTMLTSFRQHRNPPALIRGRWPMGASQADKVYPVYMRQITYVLEDLG